MTPTTSSACGSNAAPKPSSSATSADAAGHDTAADDELIGDLDEEITRSGMRGKVLPAQSGRRHRSTRRRQDAPDLPRRKIAPRTIGKTYTAPDGKTFRPSMFITLTCPSYGKVGADGTPADPAGYDYRRAARDALHFAALFDRLIQNLRRFLGYDVQYFAAVEPQRRLAPHIHVAIRGTLSRTELRQVLAATYHQVWWPPADTVRHDDGSLPVWHEPSGNYLDPATGEVLPDLGPGTRRHRRARRAAARRPVRPAVRRPGRPRRITRREPVHRLPDQVPDQARRRLPPGPTTAPRHEHAERLARRAAVRAVLADLRELAALRHPAQEPAPGPAPGHCRGKAHRREHLGYAGRRVLVSRKWSGKTLADHRADRRGWLLDTLGIPADDPARYTWEPVTPGDPDHMPNAQRLLHIVADRQRWHAALTEARARASGQPPPELSATGRAA